MAELQIDLKIVHHFMGGRYMKEMHLPAQHYAETHKHVFDHDSVLLRGRVLVEVDGVTTEHEGPDCIRIGAGQVHTITALTDAEWYCIHETDETDPERIDHQVVQRN